MRQQCVFLSLLSYCFIREKDSGKREKLKRKEPEGIREGDGVKAPVERWRGRPAEGNGMGAPAGHGFLCEVGDQGRLGFRRRRF